MELVALASLFGTVAGLWIKPPVGELVLLAAAVPALILAARFGRQVLFALLGAYCWATLHGFAYQSRLPGIEIRDQDIGVSGCVIDFPRVSEHSTSFLFELAGDPSGPSLLYLRSFDQTLQLQAGDCYDLVVRLKPPHGLSNPGQSDRQLWLMMQRVHATGYVRPGSAPRARPDLMQYEPGLRMRRYVLERMRAAVTTRAAEAALLEGLTVGVRSAISQQQWQLFRATGTIHLMAISGLHVGLVAAGLWWMVSTGCRFSGRSAWRWPATLAAGGGALGYAVLAGWSAPTSRAALMCLLLLAISGLRRAPRPITVLSAVAVVALVADPFVVFSSGFWMSYLAVLLLVTLRSHQAIPGLAAPVQLLIAAARAQVRLSVGLALPNMLLFDAMVILGPLVNLLAIPVFSLLVLPLCLIAAGCLLIVPVLSEWSMAAATAVLAAFVSALEYAERAAPLPPDWLAGNKFALPVMAAVTAVLLVPAPLRSIRTALASLMLAGGVIAMTAPPPPLRIDVLDVGQGTAVVVRTPARALLVDTGPRWPGGDAGVTTVLPFLRAVGVKELDAVLVSHADTDHIGGLNSVISGIPVGSVFMPSPPSGSTHFRCDRGMSWRWEQVDFQIVHPAGLVGWSENEASCILLVRYREAQVMLPGDIESAAESVIVARLESLQSDLVIVPHHGSKTSSTDAFVRAVRPRYAVATTAFWNRWQFPAVPVTERWRSVGACMLDTAHTGALTFAWLPDTGLTLQAAHKRHWLRPWAIRPLSDDDCLGA